MKRSARVLHMREIPGRPLIFSFSSYFFWVAPWDLKKPVLITLTSVFSLSRKEMSGIKTPSCLGLFYTFCD